MGLKYWSALSMRPEWFMRRGRRFGVYLLWFWFLGREAMAIMFVFSSAFLLGFVRGVVDSGNWLDAGDASKG